MGMQLLLLAFSIVIGLNSVLPDDEMGPSESQKNFRNLFDSIGRSDIKKIEAYRIFLKQEAVKEQRAFDAMKERLKFTQYRNAHKHSSLQHHKSGEVVVFKREATPDALFTKKEERAIVQKLDQMVEQIPVAERHISSANQFCISRCLHDAVHKKYAPLKNLNMTSIPPPKKPLYEKLANSIGECVRSCRVPPGYRKFLMKLVEMIVNPESFTISLSGNN